MTDINAYKSFDFSEFIEDSKFKNWVLSPTNKQDEFWKQFLKSYPEKEEVVKEAKTFLLGMQEYFDQNGASDQKIKTNLQLVFEKAALNDIGIERKKPINRVFLDSQYSKKQGKVILTRRLLIAASFALLLGFFSWLQSTNETISYVTNFGEWKTLELPDGSTVKLNANSELKLQKTWKDGEDRQVFLKGEAFFTVSKQPATKAKFTVITDDLGVEVLGTSFNVHTRGEATEVYLEEGTIKLDYGAKETLMKPGDFVAYSAKKEKITARYRRTKMEDVTPDTWKDGVLFFKGEYAFTIIKKLEEIYGVEIKVKNETIFTKKYTVAIPLEELKTAIPILEKSMKIKITAKNNQLIFE